MPRPFPLLEISEKNRINIEEYETSDFKVKNYFPWPKIQMDMSA